MPEPIIFNIQKFSVRDGDGIRTTIFFKGCPLRCLWCHNPESQLYKKELVFRREKCTACGRCVTACPKHGNVLDPAGPELRFDRTDCNICGNCEDVCLGSAREVCGKNYSIDELVKKAARDKLFYEQSGGGVTLSGGEVMVQDMDYIEELCRRLHEQGIRIFIDTSGHCPYENFKRILPYTDIFLYDIKAMDLELHKKFIGVDNALILENLKRLSDDGAGIYIRIPVVGGVNANDGFFNALIDFMKQDNIHVKEISLLPYHDFGKGKYANLGRVYEEDLMWAPTPEEMGHFKALLEEAGYERVAIGG